MAEAERRARRGRAALVGIVAATLAFAAYATTLLPGVELGDSGGFQAAVLWPETSARRAYPLYYAVAKPFVAALAPLDPARGLNLFSAVCAAAAVGLLTFVAGLVTRSAMAGAAGGLLLAFAYTFWTQAVIAEVYALHLALVGLCLVALSAYAERPTTARLALFFAVYAVSFGNHLGMLLLLPAFAIFLVLVHPHPRDLLQLRHVALAVAIAGAAALAYLPDLLWVWTHIDAPPAWRDRVAAFWFDMTKADWRNAMVLKVDASELPNRLAMWAWDARQQFGLIGLLIVSAGAARLWTVSKPWAAMLLTAYAVSTGFALTYNVGDPHVFFLPGHFFMAFAAAAAAAPVAWRPVTGRPTARWFAAIRTAGLHGPPWTSALVRRAGLHGPPWFRRAGLYGPPWVNAIAIVALLYIGWRAWETWPSVDRSDDARAELLVARLTAGLDETNAVLLSQMEWQSENALLYATRHDRREVAWTRLADVMLHFPFLVRDNHAIGRDVVLTAGAAADVVGAYGSLFPLLRDEFPPAPSLTDTVARIPRGMPYVLTRLTPMREEPLDETDFAGAFEALTGTRAEPREGAGYQVWAGLVGQPPAYERASDRPFQDRFAILGEAFHVRMDGWLPFDSFRRGGFGHVLLGRRHLLTVERGASLVWLNRDGSTVAVYAGGLYAPKPRYRIPASLPQQVAGMLSATLGKATPQK